MDYDLRGRLDTFASGNVSSEAFIGELSAQCVAAPDFIWDVLALTDQYHRRGKVSSEFQRSVRELIERPALTHQQPLPPRRPQAQPQRSLPELVSFTPCPAPDCHVQQPITEPAAVQPEANPEGIGNSPAMSPVIAATLPIQPIVVPTIYEFRAASKASTPSGIENPAAQPVATKDEPTLFSLTLQKGEIQLQGTRAIEAAMTSVVKRRRQPSGPVQLALVATLLACLGASSALSDKSEATSSIATSTTTAASTALPSVTLSSQRYIAYPGSRDVVIQVNRTGDQSRDISFEWWTRSAGAKSGRDYRGSRPHVVHLPAGVGSMQWSIPIFANAARRHTELFYVGIGSAGSGASIGEESHATVFLMGPE